MLTTNCHNCRGWCRIVGDGLQDLPCGQGPSNIAPMYWGSITGFSDHAGIPEKIGFSNLPEEIPHAPPTAASPPDHKLRFRRPVHLEARW